MPVLKKNKKVKSVSTTKNFFEVLAVVEKMKKKLLSDMKKQVSQGQKQSTKKTRVQA